MAELVEPQPADEAAAKLVSDLESAQEGGDSAAKVSALRAITDSINPLDEQYGLQRTLAAEGALELVVAALADDDQAVMCEAAVTLKKIVSHSETLAVRLRHGKELGYSERPHQVRFNPVQSVLEEHQGIRKLVDMLFDKSSDCKDAANEALVSACHFNHENQLAFLRSLLNYLLQGRTEAVGHLDTLLAGIEVREDVAVVLDQALMPVLKIVLTGEEAHKLEAVALLGTICEERPAAAAFLVEEGALKPLAEMIHKGDPQARDAAVHTMWQLVKTNKSILQPRRVSLGVESSFLVQPLLDVIQGPGHEGEQEDDEARGFDSSDEATLLLKALAEQDPSVRENVKGVNLEQSWCCIS